MVIVAYKISMIKYIFYPTPFVITAITKKMEKNSIMQCNTCYFNIIVSNKQTDFNVISLWIPVVSFEIRQKLTNYYLAYLNALFFFVYKTFQIIYLQTGFFI